MGSNCNLVADAKPLSIIKIAQMPKLCNLLLVEL